MNLKSVQIWEGKRHEFENRSVEIIQGEKWRFFLNEWTYEPVSYQKVKHICNWNDRSRREKEWGRKKKLRFS